MAQVKFDDCGQNHERKECYCEYHSNPCLGDGCLSDRLSGAFGISFGIEVGVAALLRPSLLTAIRVAVHWVHAGWPPPGRASAAVGTPTSPGPTGSIPTGKCRWPRSGAFRP